MCTQLDNSQINPWRHAMLRRKNRWLNIFEDRSMFGILRDFGNHQFAVEHDADREMFSTGAKAETGHSALDGENKTGGIIVFAAEANSVQASENSIIDRVITKIEGTLQDKNDDKNKIHSVTAGKYVRGQYKAQNGSIFTENSVCAEVTGVSDNMLFSLAEDICKDFQQTCILVKSYRDGGIYFADAGQLESV